jgi:hypothetical protein
MKISTFLLIIFIHLIVVVSGQIPAGKFTSEESRNFQIITKAIQYLKAQKTKSLDSFDSTSTKVLINQYKDFYKTFFDLNYITDTGAKQHPTLSLDFQSAILYNIDHYLDVLPLDSVYIASLSYFDKSYSPIPDSTSFLNAFYRINGKEVIIYTIAFTGRGKIKGIGPFIDFEGKNKGVNIQGFYERQEDYDKIKGKLYDITKDI